MFRFTSKSRRNSYCVTLSSTQNSQNVALLNSESSINPDIKDLADSEDMIIVQDDSFIYDDRFAIPDIKFEKSTISDQIRYIQFKKEILCQK